MSFLLIASLLGGPARAASDCKDAPRARPVVAVAVSNFPTVVEHSRGIADIGALHPVKKPRGLLSQGLTVAEYRLRYSTDLEGACGQDCPSACAWVGAFTVDLTPLAVRIYIPREYRVGSCEYEELMRHERGHELLHRRRLGDLARDMRAALARAQSRPELMGPIEARDRSAAFDLLTGRLERVMRPVYDAHIARLREENAPLDSMLEYKRLGKACRGWILRP